jgi:hypothetical protein
VVSELADGEGIWAEDGLATWVAPGGLLGNEAVDPGMPEKAPDGGKVSGGATAVGLARCCLAIAARIESLIELERVPELLDGVGAAGGAGIERGAEFRVRGANFKGGALDNSGSPVIRDLAVFWGCGWAEAVGCLVGVLVGVVSIGEADSDRPVSNFSGAVVVGRGLRESALCLISESWGWLLWGASGRLKASLMIAPEAIVAASTPAPTAPTGSFERGGDVG